MAFRKRVSISKGLRLNISGKGVGISSGIRGARVSVGVRGVKTTLSIPGTGLYKTTTISGASKTLKNSFNTADKSVEANGTVKYESYKLLDYAKTLICNDNNVFLKIPIHNINYFGKIARCRRHYKRAKSNITYTDKVLSELEKAANIAKKIKNIYAKETLLFYVYRAILIFKVFRCKEYTYVRNLSFQSEKLNEDYLFNLTIGAAYANLNECDKALSCLEKCKGYEYVENWGNIKQVILKALKEEINAKENERKIKASFAYINRVKLDIIETEIRNKINEVDGIRTSYEQRLTNYQEALKLLDELRDFCFDSGADGITYYNNKWEDNNNTSEPPTHLRISYRGKKGWHNKIQLAIIDLNDKIIKSAIRNSLYTDMLNYVSIDGVFKVDFIREFETDDRFFDICDPPVDPQKEIKNILDFYITKGFLKQEKVKNKIFLLKSEKTS